MKIRLAEDSDAPAIADIWNAVILGSTATYSTQEKTREDIEALLDLRPVLVASDTRVRGFATYGPFRSGPGYRFAAEHSIYLRDGSRGRGIGRALYLALEEVARAEGIDILIAGIDGANTAAARFHERLGFTRCGVFPGIGEKFGRRHDLVLMQKNLVARR